MRNFLMREKLPVHAPVNLISKASRMFTSGRDENGGADAVRRAEGLLMEYLRCPTVSLDEVIDGQSQDVAGEIVDGQVDCPADAAQRADFGEIVGRTLLTLTKKQREVLVHRFGLGGNAVRTLTETARAVGISHQQVSMRERRALKQLERVLQPLWAELERGASI
jgi:RNA polymerase sigma factor (sigma-70 family)